MGDSLPSSTPEVRVEVYEFDDDRQEYYDEGEDNIMDGQLNPPTTIQQMDDGEYGDGITRHSVRTEDRLQNALAAPPERETWGSKLSYFLTLVGYAVGFGNIWRFPYQMRENGGLVFLIPYSIMLAVLGIPIFFLELAVGQRRRKAVVHAWAEISPSLGGIGISCGWLCFMIGLYYNTLIAYCISYFVDSFRNPLPWTDCSTATLNTVNGAQECKQVGDRSTKYYWYRRTLDISARYDAPGNYNWYLCLYIVISWVAIYAILIKGTKSVGMVVYVTAIFPYFVLLIFFIANCFIEPAKGWLGAYRLLKPDWKVLYNPLTWLKAGSQIFFSLSLAEGCLVLFASYTPARNNCHKDAINISLINCSTSLFAALVVFPMIGALGHRKYEECVKEMSKAFTRSNLMKMLDKKYDIYFFTNAKSWMEVDSGVKNITIWYGYGELSTSELKSSYGEYLEEPVSEMITQNELNFAGIAGNEIEYLRDCSIGMEATASGGGTGFVFMGFTEAVKHMPGANVWSVLFFTMLLTLGIDSGFGTVEGVIASVVELTNMDHWKATIFICGLMMTISILLFPFGWGPYILDLLDQWAANWTYLLIALLECIATAWCYGLAQISYDIRLMTGSKPNVYLLLCWKYFSPFLISAMLIGSVSQFIYETVQSDGFTYTAFQPNHKESIDGDVQLSIPGYVLVVGFLLMIFCVIWVPLHCILRKTKYSMLKEQAPAHFPEEELRQERNINVVKEEDQFTSTERLIMGQQSLLSLQKYRDEKTSLMGKDASQGTFGGRVTKGFRKFFKKNTNNPESDQKK